VCFAWTLPPAPTKAIGVPAAAAGCSCTPVLPFCPARRLDPALQARNHRGVTGKRASGMKPSGSRHPAGEDGPALVLRPIGVARTPFTERAAAPRQPYAAAGAPGTIELLSGRRFEDALEDLGCWDRIWVLFWFHLNEGWRPKVLPPRSKKRRGLFATRSPHRPNPIGMSVLRLERIEGLVLHVRDVDLVDGTPILDLKPYVPYADAHPDASPGWVESLEVPAIDAPARGPAAKDPEPGYAVAWSDRATAELAFLGDAGVELAERIAKALTLGPQPHAYRRIRRVDGGLELAVKDWRVRFRADGRTLFVERLATGYRTRELAEGTAPGLALHRSFAARFGS
jgi:tRNA-Thr(GGU) m(6)t(6)A37 methyltransferase TsaA